MRGESIVERIEIKNVRSLKDTGLQSIAPITLLVGENSSGKSTFLRTFPLFRQSISKKTSGPLLWVGDTDDYVDFGSFDETITENENEMEFSFYFTHTPHNNYPLMALLDDDNLELNIKPESIIYRIVIKKGDNHEIVSRAMIRIGQHSITIITESEQILLDEIPLNDIVTPESSIDNKGPFSSPFGLAMNTESIFGFSLPHIEQYLYPVFCRLFSFEDEETGENKQAESNFSLGIFLTSISCLGQWIISGYTLNEIHQAFEDKGNSHNSGIGWIGDQIKRISEIANKNEQYSQEVITKISLLSYFYLVFEDVENYISRYFRNVHYIAPVRATAERYYRSRNLAVDEIDYQGKNLSVFLNSLSEERLAQFQEWTRQYFGFEVVVRAFEGNLSLRIIICGSKREVNLSDTGFGYSQILPIITQLWDLSTKRSDKGKKTPLMLAIEQPELHLHPAMQAKLANAFIACIRLAESNKTELQFLLETHSETIVNHFGIAIAKGQLSPDDVNVILFNKDTKINLSEVHSSGYDENGYLKDWPVGFFSPRE